MNRITKFGLATMLFVIVGALTVIMNNGWGIQQLIIYVIGLVGALCFIIPNDKKS
jgi:hypothetical protein